MNYQIAFYGGSFNPFTEGHRVCLCHAITMYDRVIVGIGVNQDKKSFLSPEQSVLLIRDSLSDFVSMFKHRDLLGKEFSLVEQLAAERLISNPECVKIVVYNGLTIDAAIANGAGVLVRGERLVGDHDSEMQLAYVNRELCRIRGYELQTVLLPVSKVDLTYVSSSLVKKLMNEGEYIATMKYVSPSVHNFLCEKVLKDGEYAKITSDTRTHCGWLCRNYRKAKYHNFSHVAYMLNFLKIFSLMHPDKCICKKEIKLAAFWHDFEVKVKDAESCSAEHAWNIAIKLGYNDPDLVKELILATNHRDEFGIKKQASLNLSLMHDLDLAILGDEQNYGLYSWMVMKEYAKNRAAFLENFLSKKRIFETQYFYDRFENIARCNLEREKAFWLGMN